MGCGGSVAKKNLIVEPERKSSPNDQNNRSSPDKVKAERVVQEDDEVLRGNPLVGRANNNSDSESGSRSPSPQSANDKQINVGQGNQRSRLNSYGSQVSLQQTPAQSGDAVRSSRNEGPTKASSPSGPGNRNQIADPSSNNQAANSPVGNQAGMVVSDNQAANSPVRNQAGITVSGNQAGMVVSDNQAANSPVRNQAPNYSARKQAAHGKLDRQAEDNSSEDEAPRGRRARQAEDNSSDDEAANDLSGGQDSGNISSRSDSPLSPTRKLSSKSGEVIGRCPHCAHCHRLKNRKLVGSPKLSWIIKDPGINDFSICLDKYDADAVKKTMISEKGHITGCYDYPPYLTIDEISNADQKDTNRDKEAMVARTKPRITPMHTPFPEYGFLNRREQRLNKPFSQKLFLD